MVDFMSEFLKKFKKIELLCMNVGKNEWMNKCTNA